MTKYEDLSKIVRTMLEDAVSTDPYGLSPNTLYKNIVCSSVSTPDYKVAEIMEVPIILVDMIRDEC